MNDPIKVIWKYKNNNRRVQYQTYIFVGGFTKDIDDILEKIKDLNFYNTLIKLTKDEHKRISERYGEKWFEKFFNTYHINFTLGQIRESKPMQKEIIKKLGQKWFDSNILVHISSEKKLIYNYAAKIKDEIERKMPKKKRRANAGIEDVTDMNYKLTSNPNIKKLMTDQRKKRIRKGEDKFVVYPVPDPEKNFVFDDAPQSESEENVQEGGGNSIQEGGEDIDIDDYFNTGIEQDHISNEEVEEIEEIEEIYKGLDQDVDKNASKTKKLIQEAFSSDREFNKKNGKMLEFDQSNDNNVYDQALKDVFQKRYVKTLFIYKDDTIKSVKEKICYTLNNNKKFGKNPVLIPSRQYIWCEYIFQNEINKVMLGWKWLRRNELLDIDIEPNNSLRKYEDLVNKLKTLRDNMKRYGNKIRPEDDENMILHNFDSFLGNNALYMIDIYNELGTKYTADNETFKNLQDIYIKLYFPKIRADDLRGIIGYLNNDPRSESNKMTKIYDTINNDILIETEIMDVVETVKMKDNYKPIFKENYITHSVIYLNLRLKTGKKIDLFRIFNEFEVNETYPFVQYHTTENGVIKYYEKDINNLTQEKENAEILHKWFENTPFGISFKVKIKGSDGPKYTGIGMRDTGRIEYKTQWKEIDMKTEDNIKNTYEYVRGLVNVINKANNKVEFHVPQDMEFGYAFINSIQKFELPGKHYINHNILSNFSRFFYPYVALVINPRKRQAKVKKSVDTSKFGTYLRYKRVAKYENRARLEQRIIYFIRNYEHTDSQLANEISKQFNITDERALKEVERVKTRYPNLKKSRKVLKKLEDIPKYKPPGIDISIQGKTRDKYKIRISGARDKIQLDRMLEFMNILIFLYFETYLLKKKNREVLKEKLKKLTNIAKRRNKVEDIVRYDREIKSIKQMAKMDPTRVGYKTSDKGQNQWSRRCQNSGTDKKRQPQIYNNETLGKLVQKGYKLNKKTDTYERKVQVKNKKGKIAEVTLTAIKLPEYDSEGKPTGNFVYYACDPEDNGDQIYVGFLTKSNNPYGYCSPCCFIINQATSKNEAKRKFFDKCLGKIAKDVDGDKENKTTNSIGDMLYILQDTNKIQEGRLGSLPKYLDYYINDMMNKKKTIKHHYLTLTNTGYCFKLGVKQGEYKFLNAISPILDKSVEEIRKNLLTSLENDKDEHIFTSLNSGNIKTRYGDIKKYIHYVKTSNFLSFELIGNLLCIPKVVSTTGLNIVIFKKHDIIIRKALEKEKVREDFYIDCDNLENINEIQNPKRNSILLLKENNYYYPIIMVTKKDENAKKIQIDKTFSYSDEEDNIMNHIKNFYHENCQNKSISSMLDGEKTVTAKFVRDILLKMPEEYHPKYQVIDTRNKCKYIITKGCLLIPTHPSGSLYDVRILKKYQQYIKDMNTTVKEMMETYTKSKKILPVKPIGVYYDSEKNGKLQINSIMTQSNDAVPVTPVTVTIDSIKKLGLIYKKKPLTDDIDCELSKGKKGIKVDERIINVRKNLFKVEAYQLFRLELSEYINRDTNINFKKKLERTMHDKKMTNDEKINKIKTIIFKIVDPNLHKLSQDLESAGSRSKTKQSGGKPEKFVHIAKELPNLVDYEINNDRESCQNYPEKDTCNIHKHCHWTHNGCHFSVTIPLVVEFVNRVSEELAENSLKAFEIFRIDNYFVSDIVDYNNFTERPGQKIFKTDSTNIKKILTTIFGSDNIPKIGKFKLDRGEENDYDLLNAEHPPLEFEKMFTQDIIHGNMTILRAYVNCYYWIKNRLKDYATRNLGYYNTVQADFSNYFRGTIITWLLDSKNKKEIEEILVPRMDLPGNTKDPIKYFTINMAKDPNQPSGGFIELYILSRLNKIPIVVTDSDSRLIYIFDNGVVYDKYSRTKEPKNPEKYTKNCNVAQIRFDSILAGNVPEKVDVLLLK